MKVETIENGIKVTIPEKKELYIIWIKTKINKFIMQI